MSGHDKIEYNLTEKVVLLTGGAIGIGAKAVEYFLDEGVKHITFLDILQELGEERQNDLRNKYGSNRVTFFLCDITKEQQLHAAYQSVVDKYGGVDIVVNNAAVFDESQPRREIDVNFAAVVTSTIKAISLMHKGHGGHGGVVVNVSSIAAFRGNCLLPVYIGTKIAVLRFSNSIGMPEYYSRTGVRVLALCFGVTDTSILKDVFHFDESLNAPLTEMIKSSPLQKVESAARSIVQICKRGDTGTSWLSIADRPPSDITNTVAESFGSLQNLFL